MCLLTCMGKTGKSTGLALLIFLAATLSHAADHPKDNVSWWVENYGVVSPAEDPMVGRAEQIFERVLSASDKKGNRFPKLAIIRAEGDPYAMAIKDGSVIFTHGALKLCYKGTEQGKGDARVAFILGHELAHLAKDDFWHSAAFAAVKQFGNDRDAKTALIAQLEKTGEIGRDGRSREFIKTQELQSDSYGLIYMTIAGYDPKSVVSKDGTNFFEEWVSQITGKVAYDDPTHPSPKQRAEFLRAQLAPVVQALDLFAFGVRFYQIGRHQDALLLFESFKERFPGREVFNNIGLTHYAAAMKILFESDCRRPRKFKLSTVLDTETMATKLRETAHFERSMTFKTRGGDDIGTASNCLANPAYKNSITQAIRHFEKAVEIDPGYVTGRVNLSSALIMAEDFTKAIAVTDEALKGEPQNSHILNNKAVALYLFGSANRIDMTESSLAMLKELAGKDKSFNNPLYNMALIAWEERRASVANEYGNQFLETEASGAYARIVEEKMGLGLQGLVNRLDGGDENKKRKSAPVSPVPLGDVTKASKAALSGMKKQTFVIGQKTFDLYENEKTKILVCDDTIQIVETLPDKPVSISEFKKTYGEPVKTIKNQRDETLLYDGFAVDVGDNAVQKIVYFMKSDG